MMGAVEGVTGLHRNRDGNTITETQEGAEKRPWNSSQDKSKDSEQIDLDLTFSMFFGMLANVRFMRMKKA